MKRILTVAAFLWACTFPQQAQIGPKAFRGDMQMEWSGHFLASGHQGGALTSHPSLLHGNEVMHVPD